mmetsp:Transcript_31506/g.100384  ORF Transcript_31506/g.100384 Transcript_31506/m.100384 type:complete len:281 (-) Transcript_31506:84-926(-)
MHISKLHRRLGACMLRGCVWQAGWAVLRASLATAADLVPLLDHRFTRALLLLNIGRLGGILMLRCLHGGLAASLRELRVPDLAVLGRRCIRRCRLGIVPFGPGLGLLRRGRDSGTLHKLILLCTCWTRWAGTGGLGRRGSNRGRIGLPGLLLHLGHGDRHRLLLRRLLLGCSIGLLDVEQRRLHLRNLRLRRRRRWHRGRGLRLAGLPAAADKHGLRGLRETQESGADLQAGLELEFVQSSATVLHRCKMLGPAVTRTAHGARPQDQAAQRTLWHRHTVY